MIIYKDINVPVKHEYAKELRSIIEKIITGMPNDYESAKEYATEATELFHQELASAFAPHINKKLAALPHGTLEQCRTLATFCNSELSELHLRIRCTRTGLGAILVVDIRNQEQDAPRFRLQATGLDGKHVRSYTSRELPVIELIPDKFKSRLSNSKNRQ
jgi:hypothetical protein